MASPFVLCQWVKVNINNIKKTNKIKGLVKVEKIDTNQGTGSNNKNKFIHYKIENQLVFVYKHCLVVIWLVDLKYTSYLTNKFLIPLYKFT